MDTLIILALSMLASALLTAWLLHRSQKGLSPLPTPQAKVEVSNGDDELETTYAKGRNRL